MNPVTATRKDRRANGSGRGPAPAIVFAALLDRWGPQGWWPGRTRAEIVIGAILTQNTAWANVERALARLSAAGAMDFERIRRAPRAALEDWIRPAGCFRVKAGRLRAFADVLHRDHGGRLARLFRLPTAALRRTLLDIPGVGPETADAIALYAAKRPVFVVDAYGRRILARHGWRGARSSYDDLARWFTRRLPRDTALYNEYHALVVRAGKEHCRPRPRCDGCPLQRWLPAAGPRRP